jgi:hypothetical protein
MRAHFGLPSVKSGTYVCFERDRRPLDSNLSQLLEQDVEKRAPITVKFEIPYFTVSGIQVRYLKVVEKSGYQALPWVRYITQNGDDYRCVRYRVRCTRLTLRQAYELRWIRAVLPLSRCNIASTNSEFSLENEVLMSILLAGDFWWTAV